MKNTWGSFPERFTEVVVVTPCNDVEVFFCKSINFGTQEVSITYTARGQLHEKLCNWVSNSLFVPSYSCFYGL